MPLDFQSRVDVAELFEPEPELAAEPSFAENVVIVAGASFTVLFVSSVAVLMYLA